MYLTLKEAGEKYGLNPVSLRKVINRTVKGEAKNCLKGKKVGNTWTVSEKSLKKYISNNRVYESSIKVYLEEQNF